MNNMRAKVRIDLNNQMWIDIYDGTIQDIQRACLMGGRIMIYELAGEYYMTYYLQQWNINIQFVGFEITKQQYDCQLHSWNGINSTCVEAGTELLLVDNSYFI